MEELNQARSDQAQQLAEARVRVQSVANRERQDDREMKGEMRHLREQLGQAKDSKQKVELGIIVIMLASFHSYYTV